MKIKFKWIILVLCLSAVVGFIIYVGVIFIRGTKDNLQAMSEQLPFTYRLTAEDSSLVAVKYRRQLKVDEIFNSKTRPPISFIFFGEDYHIIAYKINLSADGSLINIMNAEIESVDPSDNISYHLIVQSIPFVFRVKDKLLEPVSRIYLTIAGDSIQNVVKNDSMISYHLLCKNFSIRYDKKAPIDMHGVGEEEPLVPMDILFLKRDGEVFVMIMTPKKLNSGVPADLLYNVVVGV